MKIVIHKGFHWFEILKWHECGSDESTLGFHDPNTAFNFLSMFISDNFNMMILRHTLAEFYPRHNIYKMTDHNVCQRLAYYIASGYIRIVQRADEIPHAYIGSGLAETEAEESKSPEMATSTTVASSIFTETSEPELEPEVAEFPVGEESLVPIGAAVAQAETMMKAAELGAPFCDT